MKQQKQLFASLLCSNFFSSETDSSPSQPRLRRSIREDPSLRECRKASTSTRANSTAGSTRSEHAGGYACCRSGAGFPWCKEAEDAPGLQNPEDATTSLEGIGSLLLVAGSSDEDNPYKKTTAVQVSRLQSYRCLLETARKSRRVDGSFNVSSSARPAKATSTERSHGTKFVTL